MKHSVQTGKLNLQKENNHQIIYKREEFEGGGGNGQNK